MCNTRFNQSPYPNSLPCLEALALLMARLRRLRSRASSSVSPGRGLRRLLPLLRRLGTRLLATSLPVPPRETASLNSLSSSGEARLASSTSLSIPGSTHSSSSCTIRIFGMRAGGAGFAPATRPYAACMAASRRASSASACACCSSSCRRASLRSPSTRLMRLQHRAPMVNTMTKKTAQPMMIGKMTCVSAPSWPCFSCTGNAVTGTGGGCGGESGGDGASGIPGGLGGCGGVGTEGGDGGGANTVVAPNTTGPSGARPSAEPPPLVPRSEALAASVSNAATSAFNRLSGGAGLRPRTDGNETSHVTLAATAGVAVAQLTFTPAPWSRFNNAPGGRLDSRAADAFAAAKPAPGGPTMMIGLLTLVALPLLPDAEDRLQLVAP